MNKSLFFLISLTIPSLAFAASDGSPRDGTTPRDGSTPKEESQFPRDDRRRPDPRRERTQPQPQPTNHFIENTPVMAPVMAPNTTVNVAQDQSTDVEARAAAGAGYGGYDYPDNPNFAPNMIVPEHTMNCVKTWGASGSDGWFALGFSGYVVDDNCELLEGGRHLMAYPETRDLGVKVYSLAGNRLLQKHAKKKSGWFSGSNSSDGPGTSDTRGAFGDN